MNRLVLVCAVLVGMGCPEINAWSFNLRSVSLKIARCVSHSLQGELLQYKNLGCESISKSFINKIAAVTLQEALNAIVPTNQPASAVLNQFTQTFTKCIPTSTKKVTASGEIYCPATSIKKVSFDACLAGLKTANTPSYQHFLLLALRQEAVYWQSVCENQKNPKIPPFHEIVELFSSCLQMGLMGIEIKDSPTCKLFLNSPFNGAKKVTSAFDNILSLGKSLNSTAQNDKLKVYQDYQDKVNKCSSRLWVLRADNKLCPDPAFRIPQYTDCLKKTDEYEKSLVIPEWPEALIKELSRRQAECHRSL